MSYHGGLGADFVKKVPSDALRALQQDLLRLVPDAKWLTPTGLFDLGTIGALATAKTVLGRSVVGFRTTRTGHNVDDDFIAAIRAAAAPPPAPTPGPMPGPGPTTSTQPAVTFTPTPGAQAPAPAPAELPVVVPPSNTRLYLIGGAVVVAGVVAVVVLRRRKAAVTANRRRRR
jgi:hypothetical protein